MNDLALQVILGALFGVVIGIPFAIGCVWLGIFLMSHVPQRTEPTERGIVMSPSSRQGWELHVYEQPPEWKDWEIRKP